MTEQPVSPKTRQPGLEPGVAVGAAALVDYAPDAVVSRALHKGAAGTLTLFAFAAGQELSEHSAPFDAWAMVLDGSGLFTIGGRDVQVDAGQIVLMPADVPHAMAARERFKMLLVMLRQPATAAATSGDTG